MLHLSMGWGEKVRRIWSLCTRVKRPVLRWVGFYGVKCWLSWLTGVGWEQVVSMNIFPSRTLM